MRHEFRLADIGEGLEEAEVISWRVAVGDTVARDQPLVEVMTDKSNAELPAPHAGTVVQLGAAVGDMINVGEIVAVIETNTPAAGLPVEPDPTPADTAPELAAAASTLTAETAVSEAPAVARPKASPSTRRAAAQRGIDLARVQGSGPGGRILLADLDAPTAAAPPDRTIQDASDPSSHIVAAVAAAQAAATSSPPTDVPSSSGNDDAEAPSGTIALRGVRRAVAQNMTQSWSEIPHIHTFRHVDAEPLLDVRQRVKASGNTSYQSVTPLSFFVAAVARAMHAFPDANASIDMANETITYHPHVNIGIAVAAPQGLVVPVLHHAETLGFEDLCVQLGGLIAGARAGTLPRESFRGGTVTVTNFGSLGGEQATPLIRPPEAMIFGFGSVAPRPLVIDGDVVARQTLNIVAAADHRLLDGDVTTSVLNHVANAIADPLQLVL